MNSALHILHLEDDFNDAELVQTALEEDGFRFDMTCVETEADFLAALAKNNYDIILADYMLPSFDGLAALAIAHENTPEVPFIFVSGVMGEELAIETLKNGATDYVLKQRLSRLAPAVRRALKEAKEHLKRKKAEEELKKYHAQLEEVVQERTAELITANAQLKLEISERRRAEENLQRTANELARSNADLTQFAAVVSHDLQEPLRVIDGFVTLLGRRYQGRLDAKADKYIGYTVDGVNRMQRLITDVLQYSKVGTRGRILQPVDFSVAVDKALFNLQTAVEETCAVVTKDQLPTLSADASLISRLFQNLIGNALKFRGQEPMKVHISAGQKKDKWVFYVRDNGIGIEPKYAEKIFGMFQRLHTAREYPGTGLGLAICKRIVEHHGGEIWLESEPGDGSTFYFSIPGQTNTMNIHEEQRAGMPA